MSIISVDFENLEIQIERLKEYAGFIDDTSESVRSVIGSLSEMELGKTDDELRISYRRLTEANDELLLCIAKLQKILELYAECEHRVLSDVNDLPLNMPGYSYGGTASVISGVRFFTAETGTFSGHSIINDDWLDEMIF